MKMQRNCDIFLWTSLKRTLTEAYVYMRRHQGAKVEHFDVSNAIYNKFSHGAVSYTLNGENVNVMLECLLPPHKFKCCNVEKGGNQKMCFSQDYILQYISSQTFHCGFSVCPSLTHSYQETCKRVEGKQCRPRSDAT